MACNSTVGKSVAGVSIVVVIILAITLIVILTKTKIGPTLYITPHPDQNHFFGLIEIDSQNSQTLNNWIKEIDDLVDSYVNFTITENQSNCSYENPPEAGKVCRFEPNFGECNRTSEYGLTKLSPCIFFAFNQISSWTPEFFNNTNLLPENMPDELKSYIFTHTNEGLNYVWLSCEGMYPVDKKRISSISYMPGHGFPYFYFLNKNSKEFVNPNIAVQFKGVRAGVVIDIECKAWSPNIDAEKKLPYIIYRLSLRIN